MERVLGSRRPPVFAAGSRMIHFRFYGDLNDFPLPRRRGREFARAGAAGASAKDAIEACGVPHVEIDLILIDGEPRDFGTILRDGDRVSVYPAFELAGAEKGIRLPPPLPRPARFALDNHLGRLAARLRLLGFDTLYRNDWPDGELAAIAAMEERILLSRDVGLLKRKAVTRGAWVRTTRPDEQAAEVLSRFGLADRCEPFQRCLRCNAALAECGKEEVAHLVPPRSRAAFTEFRRCPGCGRVFWPGSHYPALLRLVNRFRPSDGR